MSRYKKQVYDSARQALTLAHFTLRDRMRQGVVVTEADARALLIDAFDAAGHDKVDITLVYSPALLLEDASRFTAKEYDGFLREWAR